MLENVPGACGASDGAKPDFGAVTTVQREVRGRDGGHALDAVERHDAVLQSNFELGFGLLHLLLANV